MIRNFFLFICIAAAAPAMATDKSADRFKVSVAASETVMKYRWRAAIRAYAMESYHARIQAEIRGFGKFADTASRTERVESRVAGIDYRGHSWVRLRSSADGIAAVMAELADDVLDGVRLRSESTCSVPLAATAGRFSDLRSRLIDLRPTPGGRDELLKVLSGRMMDATVQGLSRAFRGIGFVPVFKAGWISGDTRIEADPEELVIRIPDYAYHFEVLVSR